MVAYSFKRRFVNPIRIGLGLEPLAEFPPAAGPKRQTIRETRKRGHVREGEELQLFYGQRSAHCMLIGRARCRFTSPIKLAFDDDDPECEGVTIPGLHYSIFGAPSLDEFAIGDGFENWRALKTFWREEHGIKDFAGTIIFWEGNNAGDNSDLQAGRERARG